MSSKVLSQEVSIPSISLFSDRLIIASAAPASVQEREIVEVVIPTRAAPRIIQSPASASTLAATAGGPLAGTAGTVVTPPAHTSSPVTGGNPSGSSLAPSRTITVDEVIYGQLLLKNKTEVLSAITKQENLLRGAVKQGVTDQYEKTMESFKKTINDAVVASLSRSSGTLSKAVKDACESVLKGSQAKYDAAMAASIAEMKEKIEGQVSQEFQKLLAGNNEALIKEFAKEQTNENGGTQKARHSILLQIQNLETLITTNTNSVNDLIKRVEDNQTEVKSTIVEAKGILAEISGHTVGLLDTYQQLRSLVNNTEILLDFLIPDKPKKRERDTENQVRSILPAVSILILIPCQESPADADADTSADADESVGDLPISGDQVHSSILVHGLRDEVPLDKGKGKARDMSGPLPSRVII